MFPFIQLAAGSIIGKDHVAEGKNNQDAFAIESDSQYMVAVVCDGCGEGKYSEVGANIGAKLISRTVLRQAQRMHSSDEDNPFEQSSFWDSIQREVVARLTILSLEMSDSLSTIVGSHFLFTTVGALISPTHATFFYWGDGMIIVNDEINSIGPYPNNAPPYLGYAALGMTRHGGEELRFNVLQSIPLEELQTFLLATDGAEHLVKAAEQNLPGRADLVGPIGQFFQDRYFEDSTAIVKRLRLINRRGQAIDWENRELNPYFGLLPDDTTIVIGRQVPVAE